MKHRTTSLWLLRWAVGIAVLGITTSSLGVAWGAMIGSWGHALFNTAMLVTNGVLATYCLRELRAVHEGRRT